MEYLHKYSIMVLYFLVSFTLHAEESNSGEGIIPLEVIQEIHMNDTQIVASVTSTGCTKSKDFIVKSNIENHVCEISIHRTKPDLCKRAANVRKIKIKWDKTRLCDSLPIKLLNSITTSSHQTQ